MIQTLPLALPGTLVDLHRIDLSALYSQGWGVQAYDVTAAPNGQVYALYGIHRYTYGVEDDEQDPSKANFRYRIITRYAADGEILASAVCCSSYTDSDKSAVVDGSDMTLGVLPDGTLAVSAQPDSTTLIAPDLGHVLGAYNGNDGRPYRELTPSDPFASSINVTPSGRLLCATTEFGVWSYGNYLANIIGVADGALTATSKPVIEAIASLDPAPEWHSDNDLRDHIRYRGGPVGKENRPRPALTELFRAEDRLSKWRDSRLWRPAPLADDLFAVPVFARTFRGGSRGQPFVFALINDQGEITGRLHGLDLYRDSPFTGFDFGLAADPHCGYAFHLNRYGLYAWNKDGVLRAKLDTTEKAFKPLTHFSLTACTPAGALLLVHDKQHLILRVPVPEDLTTLPDTVEEALRTYARQRRTLKQQWTPTNWHWTSSAVPVHHL